MKPLRKHGKSWIFLTHPLGHDPYNSYETSYMVDTEVTELVKVKTFIVDQWLKNQQKRVEVATAGVYQKSAPTVALFDGNPLL